MFIRLGREDLNVVLRDLGMVIQWSSVTFLVPIIVALCFREPFMVMLNYAAVAVLAFAIGFALKRVFATQMEMQLKHAFTIVALIWIVYTALAALPFVLIHSMSFLDAFFEAMSALTTTGLSIMMDSIDSAPLSLIFWRSLISWIGGVGIIVLALVGILTTYTKSAKLIVAEGREERLKPNIKNTVREIWSIYLILTLLGIVLLYFSGLDLFGAINYSMSAISTTGMDTASSGLQGLHNLPLDFSLALIMVLGATSFSIHYLFFKSRAPGTYFADLEFRLLIILSLFGTLAVAPKMILFYGSNLYGLEHAFFHTVSAFTCGGFALVPYGDIFKWEDFIKIVLVGLMLIGGSSGSTAGGIKLSRFWIFVKSIYWKIKASILPKESFFQRSFEGRIVEAEEVKEISQFILLYIVIALAGVLVITAQGYDLGNAAFEVVSAQSNVGISTGITHSGMNPAAEVMLILNMWIGRLEIIPLLAAIGFAMSMKFDATRE